MLKTLDVKLVQIGYVENKYIEEVGPNWEEEDSRIVVFEEFKEGLQGLEARDEIYVIYWLHKIREEARDILKVYPRGKVELGLTGVFNTRSPRRPNPIGLTRVKLLKVENNVLTVKGLDALNNTPVLDIKPVEHKVPG